jgi:hypothetical protein
MVALERNRPKATHRTKNHDEEQQHQNEEHQHQGVSSSSTVDSDINSSNNATHKCTHTPMFFGKCAVFRVAVRRQLQPTIKPSSPRELVAHSIIDDEINSNTNTSMGLWGV